VAALNPRRARILIGGLIAAGVIFTVLVLALDEDGRQGFPAGVRLPAQTAEGASWSPDGRWVAIPNSSGVLLRDPDGERSRQLRAPRTPRYLGTMPGRIGWSRDGEELRYVTTVGPEKMSGAWVTTVPVDGGKARQLGLGTSVISVGWSPRGPRLLFTTGPNAFGPGGDVGPRSALWELRRLDAEPRQLVDLPGDESGPEFSPDTTRILFSLEVEEGRFELWVVRSDGGGARRLAGPFLTLAYRWAPNNRRVALVAAKSSDGDNHLYVIPASGGKLRDLSGHGLAAAEPAWTPGGRWIAYATRAGEIEKVRLGGADRQKIADFDGERIANLLWSPDGKRLAYSSEEIVERTSD